MNQNTRPDLSRPETKPYCPGCGRKHPQPNDFTVLADGSKICQECDNNWGDGELIAAGYCRMREGGENV